MTLDEQRIAAILENKGISCRPFSKEERRKGKTPDFRAYREDQIVFYCEVKTSEEDVYLDRQLDHFEPGTFVETLRNDPIFNRISAHIHSAHRQFDAVNGDLKLPNVLAFVNHDSKCGFSDLLAVLTGNFFADDGEAYPIYRQFSEGRIVNEKMSIHMYIWVDAEKQEKLLFTQSHKEHHQSFCKIFEVKPSSIKQI